MHKCFTIQCHTCGAVQEKVCVWVGESNKEEKKVMRGENEMMKVVGMIMVNDDDDDDDDLYSEQ